MEQQIGDRIVKALDEQPILQGMHVLYFDAFRMLSETRTSGMGPNPICLQDMQYYHELYSFPDPLNIFIETIHAIDIEWLTPP